MKTAQIVVATPRITRYLTMMHFANDFFSGSLGILMAASTDRLHITATQIGIAAGLFQGVSLIQPALGWLTDRIERSYLMLLGAFITALGLFFCSLANSVEMIYVGAFIGGIGNAMFHPIGLASARAFAQKNASGRSVALFMFGGNSALALGPLILGYTIDHYSLDALIPFVALSGFILPILVYKVRPYIRGTLDSVKTSHRQAITEVIQVRRAWWQATFIMLTAYLMVSFLRGTLQQCLSTYLPTYYKQQSGDLTYAGIATSFLLFFAAMGSYLGASLSDYFPRRRILLISLTSMTPLFWFLLHANGVWIFVLSMALGLMVNANWPILLMIGQEVLPGKSVSASGFAFGWGFFSSAVGSYFVGRLADAYSLQQALEWVAFLPLIAALLVYLLPGEQRYSQRESATSIPLADPTQV